MDIEIGKALTVNVELTRLGFEHQIGTAAAHVVKIGLRNILMDAHANVKREDFAGDDDGAKAYRDASLAKAMTKLEALYKGDVRANAVTRQSSADPVEAEAMRMARTFVYGKARGWEENKGDSRKWIDAAQAAMGLPGIVWNVDGFADAAKAVLAEAIKRRAARDDVKEAARKIVEAAKAVKVESADDLGL